MTPTGEGRSRAFEATTLGHCGWNEYHARDWEAAFDFYVERFGWVKDQTVDMGPMGLYQTFTVETVQTGGMMNNPLPQQAWLFYFNVGDIDAAVDRITRGHGMIQVPPMQVPGEQWALVARDPQGALFGLLGRRA